MSVAFTLWWVKKAWKANRLSCKFLNRLMDRCLLKDLFDCQPNFLNTFNSFENLNFFIKNEPQNLFGVNLRCRENFQVKQKIFELCSLRGSQRGRRKFIPREFTSKQLRKRNWIRVPFCTTLRINDIDKPSRLVARRIIIGIRVTIQKLTSLMRYLVGKTRIERNEFYCFRM